jgi:hypothetical protein
MELWKEFPLSHTARHISISWSNCFNRASGWKLIRPSGEAESSKVVDFVGLESKGISRVKSFHHPDDHLTSPRIWRKHLTYGTILFFFFFFFFLMKTEERSLGAFFKPKSWKDIWPSEKIDINLQFEPKKTNIYIYIYICISDKLKS